MRTSNALNQYVSRTVPGNVQVHGEADAAAVVTVNENPTWRSGEYFYGEAYLPTYDANGNISEYIDSSDGSIAAHYDYSPFGETLIASGPLASSFTHRFSTKPWCGETASSEFQLRRYFPSTGSWGSRDYLNRKIQVNLYRMLDNDVVNYADLLGLESLQKGNGKNCVWRIFSGHFVGYGTANSNDETSLKWIDRWFGDMPRSGYQGSDCGDNKEAVVSCNMDWLNGIVIPLQNRIPLSPGLEPEPIDDNEYKYIVEEFSKMRNLQNHGVVFPRKEEMYKNIGGLYIDLMFYSEAIKFAEKQCRSTKNCCNSITIKYECADWVNLEREKNIKSIAPQDLKFLKKAFMSDMDYFEVPFNPCGSTWTVECPK